MVKVLIVYYSKTGNTKQMATLVEEGVKSAGADVTLKPVSEARINELLDADAVIMGTPCYYGGMAAELKEYIDKSVEFHGKLVGKVGAAFCSSHNVAGGNETAILSILQAFLIHGMIVPGIVAGDHYGPAAITAPDKRSSAQCRELGRLVVKLAKKIVD